LQIGTTDDFYLSRLTTELNAAFVDFPAPNLVVYVAGTDSLSGDALGLLRLSSHVCIIPNNLINFNFVQGIIQRDQIVFRAARQRNIPIVLLTSGGYQRQTARVIADSILNLHAAGLIELR
jgi:histone deacetylase 11